MQCALPLIMLSLTMAVVPLPARSMEWSGFVSVEPRWFFDEPSFVGQPGRGLSPSGVLAPEVRFASQREDDRFTLAPYVRFDADDDHRSHVDLREAIWLHTRGDWAWRVGVGRVFWGVTESRHLVDIINQTDLVEDIDEEDKLGQPMISVERWSGRAGTFAAYLLPGFRERTFPDRDARLRSSVPIDVHGAQYESSDEDRRIDAAFRWSRATGSWDLGFSAFRGTSREPVFVASLGRDGEPVLVPRYEVISQIGADVQFTSGGWLWKLESIARQGYGERFLAMVAGFEYTLFDLGGGGGDLGLLLEFGSDERSDSAPPVPFDRDVFLGVRFAANDVDDSSILAGAITNEGAALAVVEAERRIGSRWRFEFEARMLIGIDADDSRLGAYRNDSFATLRLARFF